MSLFLKPSQIVICVNGLTRKRQITARLTGVYSIVGPQDGTRFLPYFWLLEFRGDSWIIVKFVNP